MKIGIARWTLDLAGGAERQTLELAKQLRRMGYEVELYCVRLDPQVCFPELLAEVQPVHSLCRGSRTQGQLLSKVGAYWDLFAKQSRMLAELISSEVSILNCHDYTAFLAGAYFRERTGKPVVGMLNDLPGFRGVDDFGQHPLYFLVSWAKRKMFRSAVQQMDKIVVLDPINRRRLQKYFAADAAVFPSGLDLAHFLYQPRAMDGRRIHLLAIGSVSPWRRFEDVIEALRILVGRGLNCEVHLVGSPAPCKSYAARIRRMVFKYQLEDRVTFHGYVEEKQLAEIYTRADVFVFPNYPQILGLAVYEAMACGIPVVANDGYGADGMLRDGETALLVPPQSPRAIADAVVRLQREPDLYRQLSLKGREFTEKNIRWDLYAANMLRVFSDTLSTTRQQL